LKPKKSTKKKKRKSKRIAKETALRRNRERSTASRAIDAVRKTKKKPKQPNSRWAKKPGNSDVIGIDDGSKLSKKRNQKQIKAHFGKIGRKGANKTNAKRANKKLLQQTPQMKTLIKAKRETNDPKKKKKLSKKIQFLKKDMVKNQKLVARWPKSLN
jgi:hypothetical protein